MLSILFYYLLSFWPKMIMIRLVCSLRCLANFHWVFVEETTGHVDGWESPKSCSSQKPTHAPSLSSVLVWLLCTTTYNAWLVLTVVELLYSPKKNILWIKAKLIDNLTVATFNFSGMDVNKKNHQVKQLIFLLLSNVRGETPFQRIGHLLKRRNLTQSCFISSVMPPPAMLNSSIIGGLSQSLLT